jgi:hypothetical protein
MPGIFTKVVHAIVANSGGKLAEDKRTVDFLQMPAHAPASVEVPNESRPDGYLILRDRAKVMTQDGKKEVIQWADIVLSCEYKKASKDEDQDDVRIHQGL